MPQTNTEWLRSRLLAAVDYASDIGCESRTPEQIGEDRLNQEFIQLMKNRLMIGHFRYGLKVEQGARYDTVQALQARLKLYVETGNTEYLVDLANFCMLEFQDPAHPNAHFEAGDDNHEHAREL